MVGFHRDLFYYTITASFRHQRLEVLSGARRLKDGHHPVQTGRFLPDSKKDMSILVFHVEHFFLRGELIA